MADARLEQLSSGRLGPLLLRFSWPALLSMTLNALYTVVDRVFIGKFGSIDSPWICQDLLAGMALVFPLLMTVAAFGVMIGVGSSSLLSTKLGEKKTGDAERILGQCVALKLALFCFAPPLFFWIRDILAATGGARVSPLAIDAGACYMRTVVFSLLFSHLAFGLSACMRAEGAPRESMTCMAVGFGVNFALDPLFIWAFQRIEALRGFFGPENAGLAGAAWATNVAMAASCAVALRYYVSGRSSVKLRAANIRIRPALAARALSIGFSPFLQQAVGSLAMISVNASLGAWAGGEAETTRQTAVAGIFTTVTMVTLMPVLGLQQGLSPIIGYGWGARRFDRVLGALKLGLWTTAAMCVLVCLFTMAAARPLAWCFAESGSAGLIGEAARVLRIANCFIWCIFLNVCATTYFQSVGRPLYATGLSFLRQGVCLIPCTWLLPYAFPAHPVAAIWAAHPCGDVLAFAATLPFLLREISFLKRVSSRRPGRTGPACATSQNRRNPERNEIK